VATYICAIFGALSLIVTIAQWITTRAFPPPTVMVRPICERYTLFQERPQGGIWYVGAAIVTLERAASGIRVRLEGVRYVSSWSVWSPDLSDKERADLLGGLPAGDVPGNVAFPLPDLPPDARIEIYAVAVFNTANPCPGEWLTISLADGAVYHADTSHWTTRERSLRIFFAPWQVTVLLIVSIVGGIGMFALKSSPARRRNRRVGSNP
jgi:hypothetical protein